MKIALTGGTGIVGAAILDMALARGDEMVVIDRVAPAKTPDGVRWIVADVADYDLLLDAFAGCDAVIHMAAIPSPGHHPDHVVHNNNVVGSYNALRAAAEHGILKVCQASSVNAIGHAYSRRPRYDYLPLDEEHPTYSEDPYSLSKWICELQGESFARRYEGMTISSMRFHWVVPVREHAGQYFNVPSPDSDKHLWAYTLFEGAARACLLSLEATWTGHEAFFITAPDTTSDTPSLELAAAYLPGVPIKGDLSGHKSFFNSAKAERLLGWRHNG